MSRLAALLALCLPVVGCSSGRGAPPRPRPPAGRAPVTTGEIIQLRLALEGLELLPTTIPPDPNRLAALTAAWATFYHWPDPKPTDRARARFVEALCRARLPARFSNTRDDPPGLSVCIDLLEGALLSDLLGALDAYRASGHPDKVEDYRLSEIRAYLLLRRKQRLESLPLRQAERRSFVLPRLHRCPAAVPRAPLLKATLKRVLLDGFGLLSRPSGLTALSATQLQTVAQAVESQLVGTLATRRATAMPRTSQRAAPSRPPSATRPDRPPSATRPDGAPSATRPDRAPPMTSPMSGSTSTPAGGPRPMPAQRTPPGRRPTLLLAFDRRLAQPVLGALLGVVARLGVQNVCLVVEGHPGFPRPCCLEAHLSPRLADEADHLVLDGASSRLVRTGKAVALSRRPTSATRAALGTIRTIRMGPRASWDEVSAWISRLQSMGGATPELVLDLPEPTRARARPER